MSPPPHFGRGPGRRAAVLAVSLLVAGCAGERVPDRGPAGGSGPAPTARRTAADRFPLTGLPAEERGPRGRPALAVKIGNSPAARPQSGLEAADVVYEQAVEGGLTRFLAVFHSRDAKSVGPVRSVRPGDGELVWPLRPLFSYAGGVKPFVDLLHRAPVIDVGVDEAPEAYDRRTDRRAPHNLYSSTAALFRVGGNRRQGPPPSLFTYLGAGEPFAPPGAVPARRLELAMGIRTAVAFDWDQGAGRWRRLTDGVPHPVEGGARLEATTVIVQYVTYRENAGDTDASGAPVQFLTAVGSGDAWILAQGKAVRARWSKPRPEVATIFTDAGGRPLAIPPGITWVELAPLGSATSVR